MPRSALAASRSWRRSGTRFCLASSNCGRSARRRPPRTRSQPSNDRLRTKQELAMNIATTLRAEKTNTNLPTEKPQPDLLTETLQSKLANPERSSNFDLHAGVNDVLRDVGMSTADSGGKLTFYGRDPIIPSPHRFGTMAAIGLAAKAVAVAALWRLRTDEGQDIAVDVRKAFTRFCGFFDRKWETINGRAPVMADATNPFHHLPLFR